MGNSDFGAIAIGLLLLMAGFATSGFTDGVRGTLLALVFILVGVAVTLWAETL